MLRVYDNIFQVGPGMWWWRRLWWAWDAAALRCWPGQPVAASLQCWRLPLQHLGLPAVQVGQRCQHKHTFVQACPGLL